MPTFNALFFCWSWAIASANCVLVSVRVFTCACNSCALFFEVCSLVLLELHLQLLPPVRSFRS